MNSIFASKLYKASSRKERIQAAIIAPTNLTLVKQLADSLDEEFQTPDNLGLEDTSDDENAESFETAEDFIVDEDVDPDKDLMTVDDLRGPSSHRSPSSHSAPHKSSSTGSDSAEPSSESSSTKSDTDKPDSANSKPDANLMPDSPATEQPAETEASTKIMSATISDLSILKGTLNSRDDTSGVLRISEKDGEIWIYYNDDINLNNIMTNVIELLMESGYESFEFNRLARSDNAIVFVKIKKA